MDSEELLECLKELVRVDKRWIPEEDNCSLYIRPTYIGTQVSIIIDDVLVFCRVGVPIAIYVTGFVVFRCFVCKC